MAKLQIELQGDLTGDGKPEFKVTPIDIELPDEAADLLEKAFRIADTLDAEPGDGEFDQKFKTKVPVRLNLILTKMNAGISLDGKLTMRVKRDPVDSPDKAA